MGIDRFGQPIIEKNGPGMLARMVAHLNEENAQLKDRVAVLRRRLGNYECPEHEQPQFGECDICDSRNQDDIWRTPEP